MLYTGRYTCNLYSLVQLQRIPLNTVTSLTIQLIRHIGIYFTMDTLGLNSYISRSNMDISCRGPGDNVILSRQEQQGKKCQTRRQKTAESLTKSVGCFHFSLNTQNRFDVCLFGKV